MRCQVAGHAGWNLCTERPPHISASGHLVPPCNSVRRPGPAAGHLPLADERLLFPEIRPAGPGAGDDRRRHGGHIDSLWFSANLNESLRVEDNRFWLEIRDTPIGKDIIRIRVDSQCHRTTKGWEVGGSGRPLACRRIMNMAPKPPSRGSRCFGTGGMLA